MAAAAAAGLLLGLPLVILLPTLPALADENAAVENIETLNRRAMEDYDLLEFEAAKNTLTEALAVSRRAGLDSHPVAAKTLLNLGVVYVAGFKDRQRGVPQMVKALQLNSRLQLDPSVATPELLEVYGEAKAQAAKAGGGAPPPPVTPPSAETRELRHTPIDEAKPGEPITIKAELAGEVAASRLVLFYRLPGREDFVAEPMRGRAGAYSAEIPGDRVSGRSLQYYIEARDERGRALVASASASSPHIISIIQPTRSAGSPDGDDSENPLARGGGSGGGAVKSGPRAQPPRKWWFIGVGIGSGLGIARGQAEVAILGDKPVNVDPGLAPALLHVMPEFGVFVGKRHLLSLLGRFQVLTGANIAGAATGAIGVLARYRYFFGDSGTRAYVHANAGYAEVRYRVDLSNLGKEFPGGNVDTAKAGPGALGGGGGVSIAFNHIFGMMIELNLLGLFPDASFNADLNLMFTASF